MILLYLLSAITAQLSVSPESVRGQVISLVLPDNFTRYRVVYIARSPREGISDSITHLKASYIDEKIPNKYEQKLFIFWYLHVIAHKEGKI